MLCPVCSGSMIYRNEDFQAHGFYCADQKCRGWRLCTKDCCLKPGMLFFPGAKIAAEPPLRDESGFPLPAPVDRRDRNNPPYPGMTWSDRHGMWVDPDNRTPEEKGRHEEIAADAEKRRQEALEECDRFLKTPYEKMTPEQQKEIDAGCDKLLAELRDRKIAERDRQILKNKRRPEEK